MGLHFQLWLKRHSFLACCFSWMFPSSHVREISFPRETPRELDRELNCTPLEQAAMRSERTELVRTALVKGMPLSQLEQHLDWLDANPQKIG